MPPKKIKPKKCSYKPCTELFTQYKTTDKYCSRKCYLLDVAQKEIDQKVKDMRPVAKYKENKKALQDSINLLARKIDEMFGYTTCIDCDKPMLKQIHGAHLISVGSNNSIRYNLHNIHSALSQCNKYNRSHEAGYKQGIVKRYGSDYLELIESFSLKYKDVHLNHVDVFEKLKIVRGLIRMLHTYKFNTAMQAREQLNQIIGIYK